MWKVGGGGGRWPGLMPLGIFMFHFNGQTMIQLFVCSLLHDHKLLLVLG